MGERCGVLDVRVGTDLQGVDEVAAAVRAHGARYLDRIYTGHEIDSCGGASASPDACAPGLAARFAAKEATFKLLRVSEHAPPWREIEVRRDPSGWTELVLTGAAAQLATDRGFVTCSVSLAHDAGIGMATVVGVRRAPLDSEGG